MVIKTTLLAMLLLFASAIHGQETTLPVIKSTSTLVTVPALVRNSSGEILKDLHLKNFQLFDNGVAQKFSIETLENEPIGLAVVIQVGGIGGLQYENYRNLPNLMKSIVGNSPHEIMLMTFDSQREEIWHFPPRSDGLLHSFDHPRTGDDGVAMIDAVNDAVNLFQQEPGNFRRIVLLISQEKDDGSKTPAEEVLRNLGRGSTSVYTLTVSASRRKTQPTFRSKTKIIKSKENPTPRFRPPSDAIDTSTPLGSAIKSLQENTATELAMLSGGQHLKFRNEQDFEQQLAAIAEDIHNRSLLTFHPISREPGFHELRLQGVVRSTHLDISARTSYWFDIEEEK